MRSRPAAGGGRWVSVDPERLSRWLAGFGDQHGGAALGVIGGLLTAAAADGSIAECEPPPGATSTTDPAAFLAAAVAADRLGLLLVRRGGVAAGVAIGDRLVSSKVDGAYVQGRTAAGGWSQQRFARRRENQTRELVNVAVEVAARVLVPALPIDALITGGERRLVDTVLRDPRLTRLRDLVADRFLDVPDPRLPVLQAAVREARRVRIRVRDDPGTAQGSALPNVSQDLPLPEL
jgi:Actinobacteria/chloroflexi VLRF1 release factor